jgi:hypothetical protein
MKDCNSVILFGAGERGANALRFFGFCNVLCFADNNKSGARYCGKGVISLEKLLAIHSAHKVVLSVRETFLNELSSQLDSVGIPFETFSDIESDYMLNHAAPNERIERWKNAFKGRKCFLIGNGPGLRTSDLEKIHAAGHISMGCNFINRIFDKTDWRPDFYCNVETSAIVTNLDFIKGTPLKAKFIKDLSTTRYADLINEYEFDDVCLFNYGGAPGLFSDNLERIVYDGYTVMFIMIEFAVYMGFTAIYLLGVENTQPPFVHTTNFLEAKGHFYEENADELQLRREILPEHNISDKDDWEAYQNHTNKFYRVAGDHAESKGIRILNATRGGKLEVFERVDFDGIFAGGDD